MKLATGLKLLWQLTVVLFTVLVAYRGATWRMLIKRCWMCCDVCIIERLAYCEIIL